MDGLTPEQARAVGSVQSVCGVGAGRARALAAAAGWDAQAAIAAHFDGAAPPPAAPPPQAAPPSRAPPPRRARIATLGTLADAPGGGDDSNEYYAGGQSSGVAVQGKDGRGHVERFFDAAGRSAAAAAGRDARAEGGAAAAAGARRGGFGGSGRRLGAAGEDDDDDEASRAKNAPAQPPRPAKRRNVVITFYEDGFTVEAEGDPEPPQLRPIRDPANSEFLTSVLQGRVPRELEKYGTDLNVRMDKRMGQKYEPPPKKFKAFTGSGQKLGSAEDTAAAAAPSAASGAGAAAPAAAPLSVDASLPRTRIQVRLASGARVVQEFNHTHTVGDIRQFVDAQCGGACGAYTLLAGVPPRPLADAAATIADAGLLRASVIQKMA